MKRFSARQKHIIQYLYDQGSDTTGSALSLSCDCSIRTIQGEISAINKILPQLICSSNKGYSLNFHKSSQLEGNLSSLDENDQHVILRRLLIADKNNMPWQIDELADYMYMSTPRLEKELVNVAQTMSQFSLNLHRKKNHLFISGTEAQKRAMMHYLVIDETTNGFHSLQGLEIYFPELDTTRIEAIVRDAISEMDCYVENIYFSNIIVNIVIALDRMRYNNYIQQTYNKQIDAACNEYRIAQQICSQCAEIWKVNPTNLDISYVASLLLGQIRPRSAMEQSQQKALLDPAFTKKIQEILTRTFHEYLLNVNIESVLYGFAMHIDGLLKRSNQFAPASKDLINSMKRGAPFVYDVSVSIAQKLQEEFHTEIPDAEIGYISIHIGFLIEQSIERSEKVYILFVSDEYHQIGSSVVQKLHENFDALAQIQVIHSIDPVVLHQSQADLILSTTPLSMIGKNIRIISPFYSMMDHIMIDQAIHRCLQDKQRQVRNTLLASFFDPRLFFQDEPLTDKYDVIRFLGGKMVDLHMADDSFIDSVIKRERMSSTCFLDTFAIPHAEEMNAVQTMNCVLVSKKGIKWDEQIIHIVMMIAVNKDDRPQFMKIYNGIVQTIAQPDIVSRLVAAKDYQDFMKILMEP